MVPYALVAEFDPQRGELYSRAIDDHRLETVVVRDGQSARTVLQQRGAPILLVADLSLPQTDGFSLITDVRRLAPPEQSAIIVFSAFAELRAAAMDLRNSLGIAEIGDKNLPQSAVAEAVARALAGVRQSHDGKDVRAEADDPGELVHKILYRVAKAFRVPFVLVALELREGRRVMAYLDVREPSGTPPQWQPLQQVISHRQPLIVPDLTAHSVYEMGAIANYVAVKAFATVPLITSMNQMIGAMSLLDVQPLKLAAPQVDLLVEAAGRIADELKQKYGHQLADVELVEVLRSEEKWAALERLALTDPLTGLSNRRAGERALERETARARRAGSPFSLALIDLDHFKQVNDTHSHSVGDQALCEVGRILTSTFRASDLAVRWGGDEFLVLLPDVTVSGAVVFAERARAQLENLPFPKVGKLTMSAGVVQMRPDESPRAAIARADTELYKAKGRGRNRVESAPASNQKLT